LAVYLSLGLAFGIEILIPEVCKLYLLVVFQIWEYLVYLH